MPTKKTKKRKIALIAGSRGEWAYYRPIINEILKRPNLDYSIIATNMHVLDTFGSSLSEIEKDGFKVHATVFNTFDGYNHVTMVKSLSVFMLQLPELLNQMEADMVLIAGDRGEQLMAAIVGAHMYLPVAHIQAGETSGNIDGVTRHAITKYAHIHFTASKDAYDRVIRMGEQKERVHLVGASQLDNFAQGLTTTPEEIYKKYPLKKGGPNMLFVFHSVTEEFARMAEYMDNVMSVIREFGFPTVIITNNSDAGSAIVRRKVREYQTPSMHLIDNVSNKDYLGMLNVVDVIVGNSSSALIEAPTFKLPAVNIGNRQAGRQHTINVIHAGYDSDQIRKAIKKAMSPSFREKMKRCKNPYGDGRSAKRIVDILENAVIDKNLLVKKLTY
jgi:GDP/UDP-N,N'-diacetylbacillosamine 2-epimerase (hydrolysing)